jgi:hypothetical protein
MKLAMTMTLDGLLRALRWHAHDLAESLEEGYPSQDTAPAAAGSRQMRRRGGEVDDDRSRR